MKKHQTSNNNKGGQFATEFFHDMYPNNPLNKPAYPLFFGLSRHVMCCQTPNQRRKKLLLHAQDTSADMWLSSPTSSG